MFAIITFRHSGPIKTWSAMAAANVHNARTKPLAHAVPGAPGPRFLVGGRDLVGEVRARLQRSGIDPDRLRSNGVIAYEAILSASAAFFEHGDAAERRERLERWTAMQRDWALAHYGAHRVASMVLHVDEKTPHVHLVVLPLEVKPDRRRVDPAVRWSLVGRTISGPGQFDAVQDAYAEAMTPLGLCRGERHSGRKHEPVPVYLARLRAKESAVDDAGATLAHARAALDANVARVAAAERNLASREAAGRADADRRARDDAARRDLLEREQAEHLAAMARDRAALDAEKARVAALAEETERQERDLVAQAEQLVRDDEARRYALARERIELQEAVSQQRAELRRKAARVADHAARLAAEEDALSASRATFATFRDDLIAARERFVPIVAEARRFAAASAGLDLREIAVPARGAVQAASAVMEACRAAKVQTHVAAAAQLSAGDRAI